LGVKILRGNALDKLKEIPEQSIHTCITSPPYFNLRNYGHKDQLGLESNSEEFIQNLVNVFSQVKRVLKDDGTLWLNMGDTWDKKKQLLGIPWRTALALQQDGWILRSDIIWHKPNVMPSSVRDRVTNCHEYIFLLSKNKKYYYDNEIIKEDSTFKNSKGEFRPNGMAGIGKKNKGKKGFEIRSGLSNMKEQPKRNKRSVWTITNKPFKDAHFAVFPPDLIEPCVLAGCPKNGTILDPFAGSGTTGVVAQKHNRNAVLVELNDEYIKIAKKRLGMFDCCDTIL
jgi:site-specific DNA-methyltransferase (adenine-specific)